MPGLGIEVALSTGENLRNIASYTSVEDSTPLDPSDMTGGFGQINITSKVSPNSKRHMGSDITLTDGSLGVVKGTIRSVRTDLLSVDYQANARTAQLAVERSIQPFTGTLGACLTYLIGLCGISTNYVIDSALNSVNVNMPGGRENVYDRIKRMGAAYEFETAQVSGNIVFRRPRQRVSVNYRDASAVVSYDQSSLARSIVAYNYNNRTATDIVYPIQRDVAGSDIWQVNANETKVYTVEMDASLSSISQPTCVSSVAYDDMTASQYSVAASDETILSPPVWTQAGGSVVVKLLEDTTTIEVTIVGANLPDQSPFRIAMPLSGTDGGYYSSLRIRGTGVFWKREKVTWDLGGSQDLAPDEIGATIDVPYMETADQLHHRMLLAAERYSSDTQVLTVSTRGINRLGESGSARYPTIGELNAMFPGATIAARTAALGPTIANWNAILFATVQTDFTNQAFGNVNGARVYYDNCWYRIRSATLRPNSLEYTAERHNVIGDVYRTGETIGQWNTRWTGYQIRDVNISPMRGI